MTSPEKVRPTDQVLSPHGEGYCRYCRFVVGLAIDGRLDRHERSSVTSYGAREPSRECKGSGRLPMKGGGPKTSRLSAFRVTPETVDCRFCGKRVALKPEGYYPTHLKKGVLATWCSGGYSAHRLKDHGGERG